MGELPIIIGVSGASGSIYAREFICEVLRQKIPLHLIVTDSALTVWAAELGISGRPTLDVFHSWLGVEQGSFDVGLVRVHDNTNIAAICASGTFRFRGMIIVPCSMNTLGCLASGITDHLLTRTADVCLKEKKKLVICPRETPLNLIHLRNMVTLAEAGAQVVPAMPGFYHKPETIQDLVELYVLKLCDLFEVPCTFQHRWLQKKS